MTELKPELRQLISQANAHYDTGAEHLQRGEAKLSESVGSKATRQHGQVRMPRGYGRSALLVLSALALATLAVLVLKPAVLKEPRLGALPEPLRPMAPKTGEKRAVPEALRIAIEQAVQQRRKPPVSPVASVPKVVPQKAKSRKTPVQSTSTPHAKTRPRRDGEYMLLFRTKPRYPIEARERELEGWVDVRFTVTSQGKVVDPQVVKANPASVFDRAALRSVRRWKYRAKKRNGKAVATPGVVTRIRFLLSDAD